MFYLRTYILGDFFANASGHPGVMPAQPHCRHVPQPLQGVTMPQTDLQCSASFVYIGTPTTYMQYIDVPTYIVVASVL
jgi:hypothetical protein